MTKFSLCKSLYKSITSNEYISTILPNVYISNYKTANNERMLKEYNITCIINITLNCSNNYIGNIDYNRLALRSNCSSKDINKLANVIYCDINGLHEKIIKGHNVLIHCRNGNTRACIYVASYLMRYYNYNMKDAIEYIKIKRPSAFCKKNNYYILLKKIEKKIMIDILNNNLR